MRSIKMTSWKDDDFYIGFLNEYPDYLTQGTTKEDLIDHLRDLFFDLESGNIPFAHKVEEMFVA